MENQYFNQSFALQFLEMYIFYFYSIPNKKFNVKIDFQILPKKKEQKICFGLTTLIKINSTFYQICFECVNIQKILL